MPPLSRVLDALIRWRRWVLAAWILLALALIPGALRLDTQNAARDFFIAGSGATVRYDRFLGLFGSDKTVRVALTGEALFDRTTLQQLGELESELAAWKEVQAVYGLRAHHEPLLGYWPPDEPAEFQRLVIANRLDRNLGLVSADGRAVSLLVVLASTSIDSERAALDRLEARMKTPPAGTQALLYGEPVLDQTMDESAREVTKRFFPILIGVAVLLLTIVFRQAKGVLLPLILIGVTELMLLGTMGWLGIHLNLLLAILPPLIFTVSLASAIHVLMRFRDLEESEGLSPMEAARRTFEEKGKAIFFSVINTIAGCGSLATSLVWPVRELGIWSSIGIAMMGAAALVMYPALLAAGGAHMHGARGVERQFEKLSGRWARRLTEWCAHHRARVLGVTAIITLISLAGLPELRSQSHGLNYLRGDHPLRQAHDRIEALGMGVSALELVVENERDPVPLEALVQLSERLRHLPNVLGVVGVADVVDDLAHSMFPTGASKTTLDPRRTALRAMSEDPEGKAVLDSFLAGDGRIARVTVFVTTGGFETLGVLQREVPRLAASVVPGARSIVTGIETVLLNTQRYLLRTLVTSFGSAVVVILIGFWIMLRSMRLAIVALIPNVLPVVVVFGLMSWIGIPLDVGTAMVASIVLGLAVDDTIHTMVHYRELAAVHGSDEAIARTLEATAPAYLLTGAILMLGFGTLTFSSFLPTARFGLLCATSVGVAVLAELFLIPVVTGAFFTGSRR